MCPATLPGHPLRMDTTQLPPDAPCSDETRHFPISIASVLMSGCVHSEIRISMIGTIAWQPMAVNLAAPTVQHQLAAPAAGERSNSLILASMTP